MTIPPFPTGAATAAQLNLLVDQVNDNTADIAAITPRRIGVRLRRVANQSVNSSSSTAVSWDTTDEDTDGFFTPGVPTLVVIPSGLDGMYAILYRQILSAGPGARSFAEVGLASFVTGNPADLRFPGTSTESGRLVVAVPGLPLKAGDSFSINAFQTSGGALNLTAWMQVVRIGE